MVAVTSIHAASSSSGWRETHSAGRRRCGLRLLAPAALMLAASACTTLHPSLEQLRWTDQRGDRGDAVAQRDLQACGAAVESRRSQIAACMAARGWVAAER